MVALAPAVDLRRHHLAGERLDVDRLARQVASPPGRRAAGGRPRPAPRSACRPPRRSGSARGSGRRRSTRAGIRSRCAASPAAAPGGRSSASARVAEGLAQALDRHQRPVGEEVQGLVTPPPLSAPRPRGGLRRPSAPASCRVLDLARRARSRRRRRDRRQRLARQQLVARWPRCTRTSRSRPRPASGPPAAAGRRRPCRCGACRRRCRPVLDRVLDELEARAARRSRTTGGRCRRCCAS